MNAFKEWYMDRYWEFDNLVLEGARFVCITYHEFVLITLVIIWPAITIGLTVTVMKLWRDRRVLGLSN